MHPTEAPDFPTIPDAAAATLQNSHASGQGPMAGEIRRVLLATDLSLASEVATDWAFGLAQRHLAELLVVSVIDPGEGHGPGMRWDQVRDRRQAAAQRLVARGRPVGVSVSFLVWTGEPGESIVSAAASEGADLVVVGTHGRGQIGRLLMGSVSEYVVRHARCPVLVVRPTT